MSQHFSKFALNTYFSTPYFQSQLPEGYPLSAVLRKCMAFWWLPPNLRHLAENAKRWARVNGAVPEGVDLWYDDDGYELDPDTGRRLTDAEVVAQWVPDPALAHFTVRDIPAPTADPDGWAAPTVDYGVDAPTDEQLRRDVAMRGAEAVSEEYNIPVERLNVYVDS